ncbi:DNA/RNA non-specific endonuclease [Bradyrhizobium sp. sBnM-33]|uniref:DNA/RNA non-specific endonuclease n=1 Tax=Bradyrhizobium sp. sBnM-33 TaxID=2831780 RepID=UPI001BD19995|nr:DNA/RNA non-specific endonuclease [Bradyrhizobium sp. sBnM-33]WOH52693.1 DNA/RNA non-specific endonuclease [Bradyrhizobium sp. sBnM-33]
MQIDTEVVATTTARVDSKRGELKAPAAKPDLPKDRADRVTRYINENRTPDDIAALERAMGTNDLLSLHYFWAGIRAARSVGCIKIPPSPGDRGGSATGFMIAPTLLLTNWHVFKMPEVAGRSRVQFAYESDPLGNDRIPTWFSFAPDKFFFKNKDLDYCVVAVDPLSKQGTEELASFGWLRLNPQLGKADYGQFLSIVQHPGGQSKQIAIRENKLLPFDDTEDFLTYQSDTFRGSSGSPVFNDLWDVVALHHSGKPLKDSQGRYIGHDGQPITDHKPLEHEIKWIANEGVRTSRLVADIRKQAARHDLLPVLEAAIQGTIKPTAAELEIDVEPSARPTFAPQLIPASLPSEGFSLVLPLNVSLKVESLSNPPSIRSLIPEVKPLAAPAIVASAEPDELLLEKLNFDTDYSDRQGYDENFLGRDRIAEFPTIESEDPKLIAPLRGRAGKVLHYHHYSCMLHAQRRMPVLSACNTDYSKGQRKIKGRETFGKDEWITDSRMDEKYQLPKGFYDRWKRLDFGHLVRRDDNCWGASKTEIEYANSDTFHLTNCTPQHEAFNRDKFGFHGLWGRLENHISRQASSDRTLARLSIFAGPIFTMRDLKLEDEEAGNVYVPLSYWKVVVAPTRSGSIKAFGFVTSQKQELADDSPFEEFSPEGFEDEQATLAEIERRTVVRFSATLKAADVMNDRPVQEEELMPLSSFEDVWMGKK